jgi:hypothetical protein
MLCFLCKISVITVVVSTEELREFFSIFYDKHCPENTHTVCTGVKITLRQSRVANVQELHLTVNLRTRPFLRYVIHIILPR